MEYRKIMKRDVEAFAWQLAKSYRVVVPVQRRDGETYTFEVLNSESKISLDYTVTQTPPKRFLFPPVEVMFRFSDSRLEEVRADGPTVLFGIHPCDINAIQILDKVFTRKFEDPYYLERRRRTVIIGVDCRPAETCFCQSMGTFRVEGGFDIFLRDAGEYYVAYVASDVGLKLADSSLFQPVSAEEALKVEEQSYARYIDRVPVRVEGIQEQIDKVFRSQAFWEELARRCLGCGNCTMVCPLCCCFNVVDQVAADGRSGVRVRTWDACTLPGFSMVAGGLNFRPKILNRIRNWFYDKFKIFPSEVGRLGCVGCGRCVNYCPAGIDIREELNRMWGVEG